MDLKLNIYEKKEIVKTYTADTYDITFGTVEDLINVLDLDNMNFEDNSSLIKMAGKVVLGGMDIIKPLYKDIFDGLTDEEMRNTHIKELADVLIQVVKFTIKELLSGESSKN